MTSETGSPTLAAFDYADIEQERKESRTRRLIRMTDSFSFQFRVRSSRSIDAGENGGFLGCYKCRHITFKDNMYLVQAFKASLEEFLG